MSELERRARDLLRRFPLFDGHNDLHQVTGRPPNAQVAVSLDADRFWDLIVAAIAALG